MKPERMPRRIMKKVSFILRKSIAGVTGRRKILVFNWYNWVQIDYETYLRRVVRKSFVSIISRYKFFKLLTDHEREGPLEGITIHNYREFGFSGFNLWEICKSSILDHLLKSGIETPSDMETVRLYYHKSISLMNMASHLFKTEKPFAILVEQGFQYDMRTLVEVARSMGVRTIAVENSFIKDRFFMDSVSGGICNRHFLARNARDVLRGRDIPDSNIEKSRKFMDSYISQITRGNALSGKKLKEITGGKRMMLVLGQVASDASIVMDSPLYPDMTEFLVEAVNEMKRYREEWHTVIRLHPKESWGKNHHGRKFENATLAALRKAGIDRLGHVTLFHSEEVNTYDLMDHADCGLTINSQSGIEMLHRYKPVIVAGDSFYAGNGFTFDITNRRFLPDVIRHAVSHPVLSDHQKREIDRFIYYMTMEYMFPKIIAPGELVRELPV